MSRNFEPKVGISLKVCFRAIYPIRELLITLAVLNNFIIGDLLFHGLIKATITHANLSRRFVSQRHCEEHDRSINKRNRRCVVSYTRRIISQRSLRHKSVIQIGVCKRSLSKGFLFRGIAARKQ